MFQHFVKSFLMACLLFVTVQIAQAQHSEVGGYIGTMTYMGDLNPDFNFQKTRPSLGFIYRYHLNEYMAAKGTFGFGMIEHDDASSSNPYQLARNLSFRSFIFELSGQVELHFKKFRVGSHRDYFTPYLTVGISLFRFNPKTKYNDEWVSLQEIGTEGQLNTDFTNKEPYSRIQVAFPMGMGIKVWTKKKWVFFAEIAYRQTMTDYLDDVSGEFVDQFLLGGTGSVGADLADRSDEVLSEPIGRAGKQRGFSTNKDGYMTFNMGLTYTIFNRKCVGAN